MYSKNKQKPFPWSMMLVMMAFLVSITLISCDEDPLGIEPDPDPDPDPVTVTASFTVDNDEPMLGETVEVDASSSTVQGADALTYSWTLNSPAGSEAVLSSTSDVTATFEIDELGEYQIILEVSAGSVSDTASETVVGVAPIEEISGTISSDRTLFADVFYKVVGNLSLSGAILTIEPGTVLEFEANTRFTLSNDARLIAEGTEQDSIYFTSVVPEAGYWEGILFVDVTHPDNVMDHVVVEYAGGTTLHSSVDPANVVVGRSLNTTNITISNSTFRHSAGAGMFLFNNGALRNGSGNNTFTQNATSAVTTYTNVLHYLDNQSTYSGNNNDRVYVYPNTLSNDGTWPAIDVPYFMPGNHRVNGAELDIEAGATFEFDSEARLHIASDVIFRALGENGNEILFTGSVKESGWWDGIFIEDSRHPSGLIDNVIVEYAGARAVHSSVEAANITIGRSLNSARIAITNSTLSNGGSYGMFVHSNGSIEGTSNNVYTENTGGPVKVYARNARFLDGDSDYSGNNASNEFAWIISETVSTDSDWDAINVPYGVIGTTRFNDATLTIEPGAVVAFDTESRITFDTGSIIIANGTVDEPITFTGTVETDGWWDGIFIIDTTHPNNSFDFVTIEYGGGRGMHSSVEPANLVISRSLNSAFLSVTNSTIKNSGDYGVYIHSNGSSNADICSENTFNDNAGPDCFIE